MAVGLPTWDAWPASELGRFPSSWDPEQPRRPNASTQWSQSGYRDGVPNLEVALTSDLYLYLCILVGDAPPESHPRLMRAAFKLPGHADSDAMAA